MKNFVEKHRKIIFFGILVCTFLCVFAYNVLTPYLSDDYAYLRQLREEASGIKDVVRLAYNELFEHGGRFLHYFTFRLFLFIGNKMIFNIVASCLFVILGLGIYANVENRKKYDIMTILLSYLLVWLFSISFGETVLWITGSVVYLFATTYIVLSLALYKYLLKKDEIKRPVLMCVLMFLLALFAGNSSENNSGAAILLICIFTFNAFNDHKNTNNGKVSFGHFIKPYMIAAWTGYILGYLLLVLAPGAHNRAATKADGDYSGIVGILSHIYKLSMCFRDYLKPFIIAIPILLVIYAVKRRFKSFRDVRENNSILFVFAAIASTYALMFIPLPVKRVFFGASIFMIIAFIDLLMGLREDEEMTKIIRYSLVSILCISFFFTYLENLVNLARIYREDNERTAIMEEAQQSGKEYVEIPQFREAFENDYTAAYANDLEEDPGYWINTFYEDWYEIDQIVGIPRDEWNEKYE